MFSADWSMQITHFEEHSTTVPKDVYGFRYCFLETKQRMHNEVPRDLCGNLAHKSNYGHDMRYSTARHIVRVISKNNINY